MTTLTSLQDDQLALSLAADIATNPGHAARVALRVEASDGEFDWAADRPLMIGYRWRRKGEADWIEGAMRGLIDPPLRGAQDVALLVPELADEGTYELVLSLVLEHTHWAVDVDASGWLMVDVETRPATQWDAADYREVGGKLLVGALLASTSYSPGEPVPARTFAAPATPAARATSDAPAPAARAVAATGGRLMAPPPAPKLRFSRHFDRVRDAFRRWIGTNRIFAGQGELVRLADQTYYRLEELPTRHELNAHFESVAELRTSLLERMEEQDRALAGIASLASMVEEHVAGQGRMALMIDGLPTRQHIDTLTQETRALATMIADFGTRLSAISVVTDALSQRLPVEAACEKIDALAGQLGEPIGRIESRVEQVQVRTGELAGNRLLETACEKIDTLGGQLGEPIGRLETRVEQMQLRTSALAERALVEAALGKLDGLARLTVLPLASLHLLLVRTRFGLLAINDDDASTVGYYSGVDLPEPATVELVTRLLGPGDHFVDVGANVGAFTLVAARSVGPAGRVTSFEPAPQTFSVLRRTIELNGLGSRVDAHGVALGEAAGQAQLHLGATSGHHSLLDLHTGGASGEVTVPVARGDELLGSRSVTLYKIDVEGWEIPVLKGLSSSIARDRDAPLIVEFSARHVELAGFSAKDWMEQFYAVRSRGWLIDDASMALRPLARDEAPPPSCNILFADALPAAIAKMELVDAR